MHSIVLANKIVDCVVVWLNKVTLCITYASNMRAMVDGQVQLPCQPSQVGDISSSHQAYRKYLLLLGARPVWVLSAE